LLGSEGGRLCYGDQAALGQAFEIQGSSNITR
jgi:hypothetical protein